MRVFSAEDIDRALDFPSLVEALSEAMRGGFIAPARHHHEIERAGEKPAVQLLMPAWTESASRAGLYLGAKIVNVFPGNSARGLPTVHRNSTCCSPDGRARRSPRSTERG